MHEGNTTRWTPDSRLKELRRKADLQTTAHAWLRDYYGTINSTLTLVSLLAGIVLVSLVLVSPVAAQAALGLPTGAYQGLVATLAIVNFSIVVILLAWRFDVLAARHELAVDHYSRFASDAALALSRNEEVSLVELENFQRRYLQSTTLPRIPEKRFLRLKQWHLQKIGVSRALDRNPFGSLANVRSRVQSELTSGTNANEETSKGGDHVDKISERRHNP